jgi:hypothetical protein
MAGLQFSANEGACIFSRGSRYRQLIAEPDNPEAAALHHRSVTVEMWLPIKSFSLFIRFPQTASISPSQEQGTSHE